MLLQDSVTCARKGIELNSRKSDGRDPSRREHLLLSVLLPTEAELESMRKFPTVRAKIYKKEAQEQKKARKEKKEKDKTSLYGHLLLTQH